MAFFVYYTLRLSEGRVMGALMTHATTHRYPAYWMDGNASLRSELVSLGNYALVEVLEYLPRFLIQPT